MKLIIEFILINLLSFILVNSQIALCQNVYDSADTIVSVKIEGIPWSTDRVVPLSPVNLLTRDDIYKYSLILKDYLYSECLKHCLKHATFIPDTLSKSIDCRLVAIVSCINGKNDTIAFDSFNMSYNSNMMQIDLKLLAIIVAALPNDRRLEIYRIFNIEQDVCTKRNDLDE